MKPDIDLLLARYFSGAASGSDLRQLDKWLSLSEENQLYFEQLTAVYENVAVIKQVVREPNLEKALGSFRDYINRPDTQKSEHYSASALPSDNPQGNEEAKKPQLEHVQQTQIVHDKNRQLPKNVFTVRRSWAAITIAACIMLLITVSVVQYISSSNIVRLATLNSPQEHVLPDGTCIALSANSELKYDKHYGTDNRNLHLSGEAQIRPGNKLPGKFLVILNDGLIVEDIGTLFTVTAWPADEQVSVRVEEGAVHFYSVKDKGIMIEKGEQGLYFKTGKYFEKPFNQSQQNKQPLRLHSLVFKATPLYKVVDTLNTLYESKITVDKNSANKTITVEFDKQELEMILDVISQTLYLKIDTTGGGIRLSK